MLLAIYYPNPTRKFWQLHNVSLPPSTPNNNRSTKGQHERMSEAIPSLHLIPSRLALAQPYLHLQTVGFSKRNYLHGWDSSVESWQPLKKNPACKLYGFMPFTKKPPTEECSHYNPHHFLYCPSDDTISMARFSKWRLSCWFLIFSNKSKRQFRPRIGHEGSEWGVQIYLYAFFYLGDRWGQVVNVTPQPPGKRPDVHCSGSWVGPKVVLEGCGKSSPTGTRHPDRPTRSDSLYRLRYPGRRLHFLCTSDLLFVCHEFRPRPLPRF
jgi:hypothetical protein